MLQESFQVNSKAFFSCILLVAFCAFTLRLSEASFFSASVLEPSLNSAIALELACLERFSLESNTDFVVKKTIEQQALKKQLSSEQVVNAVNANLSEYYHSLSSSGLEFRSKDFELWDYLLFSDSNSSEFQGFAQEFKANSVKLSQGLYLVEVSYTGGFFGKRIVFARLSPSLQEGYFLIPFGYSTKMLVVS